MARPITWWRLYRGKVRHVGWAGDAAACGTEPGTTAEYVGERAPVNARVCGDCVATALHLYALAQAAQMGDPRTPERGLIGVPGVPLPEVGDDVVNAEIVGCGPCDKPEHESCCCDCYLAEQRDESANPIPADVTPPPAVHAVDLVSALRASVEAARERRMASEVEEWLCECGHSNLDHDVDDMQWCRATGECLCPGLTRAG